MDDVLKNNIIPPRTVLVDGKPAEFSKLPCAKCEWYYTIHCPHTEWCHKHDVNPYVDANDAIINNKKNKK